MDFEKFNNIVEGFIRDGAPFEVNISSRMKVAILQRADAASFTALSSASVADAIIVLSVVLLDAPSSGHLSFLAVAVLTPKLQILSTSILFRMPSVLQSKLPSFAAREGLSQRELRI